MNTKSAFSLKSKEGFSVIVAEEAELDCANAPQLRSVIGYYAEGEPRALAFDFSSVSFIDSSIISSMVVALKAHPAEPVIVVVNDYTAKVLELVRLTDSFHCVRTQEEINDFLDTLKAPC